MQLLEDRLKVDQSRLEAEVGRLTELLGREEADKAALQHHLGLQLESQQAGARGQPRREGSAAWEEGMVGRGGEPVWGG